MAKTRKKKPEAPTPIQEADGEKMFPIVLVRPTPRQTEDSQEAQAREQERQAQEATRLEVIQQLARLQFDPQDIAIAAQVSAESMTGGEADRTKAYDTGRLMGQADVRRVMLQLAIAGSSPAQKMILDIAEANKRKQADNTAGGPAAAELTTIRQHLTGLNLAPAAAPTSELARLAALKIVELQGQRKGGRENNAR